MAATAYMTIDFLVFLFCSTFLEIVGLNLDLSFPMNWDELRLDTKDLELSKFILIFDAV